MTLCHKFALMKIFYSIIVLLFPILLSAQAGESADEGNVLSATEIKKLKLADDLQDGMAKLRAGEKAGDQNTMLAACLQISSLFEQEQYHEKAISYLEQAVGLANELGEYELMLDIQSRLAKALFEGGTYEIAIESSLELFEQHQIEGQLEPALRDLELIADAYIHLSNHVKAREYYVRMMELGKLAEAPLVEITGMNNMGFSAAQLENYPEATHYFSQAEAIALRNKNETPGHVFTNLGIAWNNIGDPERSIQNLHLAEQKAVDNKSYVQHLISSIYLHNDDIYNALAYNELALKSAKKTKKIAVMSDAYETASNIYQQLYEYDKALEFYKLHLSLKDSLERIEIKEKQDLDGIHSFLADSENKIRQNLIESELKQANMEQMELVNQTLALQLEAEKQRLGQERQEQQIALLEKEKTAKEANLRATQLAAEKTRQELQLATQRNLALQREKEIEQLNQKRQLDSIELVRKEADQKQQLALMASQQEVALREQEQKEFQKRMAWLIGLGSLILAIVTGGLFYSRKLNKKLANQNQQIELQKGEIESERNRAEGLLLNILPATVANELKIKGQATPKHYDAVTVLFTDFEGFTKIASTLPPAKVVSELNECFLKFDEIAERYNLEKIKTMGDAYMCAGGLPVKNNTHPSDAIAAAKEILTFINERNEKLRAENKPIWPIRIGIHTGELVAGVVGSKKFAYDIWGDTVNVASRMESNSEAGQINISEATFNLIGNQFSCKYRGEIDVKNKGKMGMYLVDA